MTIREYFQRFHKRVTYGTVIAVVLMFALVSLRYPHLTRLQNTMLGLLAAIPISIGLLLLFRWRFKCPRCGARFGNLRRAQLGRFHTDRRMYWELWSACPSCGVSFDEPYC